jgi:hypothetical protein
MTYVMEYAHEIQYKSLKREGSLVTVVTAEQAGIGKHLSDIFPIPNGLKQ